MTTFPTTHLGNGHNRLNHLTELPPEVAPSAAQDHPAPTVEAAPPSAEGSSPPEPELPEVVYPENVYLDYHIYLAKVPRTWKHVSYAQSPTDCELGMDYRSAAEIAAISNRHLLRQMAEKGKKKISVWAVCVRRKSNFATLSIHVKPWQPVDEYDMPPTDYRKHCHRSELFGYLRAVNSVVSRLFPERHSAMWAVPAVPIHPQYVQVMTEAVEKRREWQPLFNVTTAGGAVLFANLTAEDALQHARQHNALNPQAEHRARIIQAN